MRVNLFLLFLLFFHLNTNLYSAENEPIINFEWENLSKIPPKNGQVIQSGLAGAFIGVHNDALIIAGGANFPNGPAWEGGNKVYHSTIYVLKKADSGYNWAENHSFSLPENMAYGLSVPTDQGLVCIGGMNGKQFFKKAFLLKWNQTSQTVDFENLPDIPVAVANLTGGKIGNYVYAAASTEKNQQKYFWRINLKNLKKGWENLPVWEGKARTHAKGVVQNNGETACFYLMKGRMAQANGISEMYSDGFYYNPITNEWKSIEIAKNTANKAIFLSAGTALPVGANHIFLFGGADGKGLLIAAIFAASMSSLDSSMNSVATVVTTDFIRRLNPLKNEKAYLT